MPKKKKKNKSSKTVDQTASKDRQEASRNEQVMAASSQNIYNHFYNTNLNFCTDVSVGDQTTTHYDRKAKHQAHVDTLSDTQEVMATPSTSEEEEPWQKVCSKTKTKHTKSITTSHDSGETFKIETFINTPPSTNVIFVENEKTYLENPLQFSLDIVSMWNTPDRMCTIILGIKANPSLPNSVTGLNGPLSHQQLQDLFQADHFNTKPVYTYNEDSYRHKQIGVIVIKSSAGQGHPCFTTLGSDGILNFKADQLWYRNNGENVICKHSDPTTVHIYHWFQGSKHPTLRTRQEPEEQPNVQVSNNTKFTRDTTLKLDSFGQGYSILVSGKVASNTKHLRALMKIPWLYVFDFDTSSRESGLLAACLKQLTNLYITHWDHQTDLSISDQAIIWCFLNGSKDRPESIVSEELRKWKKETKGGIEQHCRDLAKFANDKAVLNVLVLWPDLNFSFGQLSFFLQRLDESLEPSPCITFCFDKDPDNDKRVESAFSHLCNELRVTTVKILPENLCFELENHPFLTGQSNVDQLQLPYNTEESVTISKKDYDWLNEDLYVLFQQTPFKKTVPLKITEEALDAFFKGGTAHWSTWYECGTGHFDIQRDITDSILKRIRTRCSSHSKSLITLLHAPGSGGTTLAQRILWELHLNTPCVQVKSHLGSTLEQLVSKIDFLYQQTNSCIVILLDGEDEERVNMLFKKLYKISFVILYVKRHTYRRKEALERENGTRSIYWLKGEVSEHESKRLALKLQDRIEDESRVQSLKRLTREVAEGKSHCLYEFGLTAYQHEFLGIRSYVKGYLKLDQNKEKTLENWHKMVGFLALVHHYGHLTVPCQFFARLLALPEDQTAEVEDFPTNAQELIVKDVSDNRENRIRTSHYIIAQEILEQILSRHRIGNVLEENDRLSELARRNLKQFILDFIKYTSEKKGPTSITTQQILARTFIYREYKDFDFTQKKKHTLSRLLLDIVSKPPYTERLEILETLTHAFPTDPNFHAHLGRFYANERRDEFEKAEECFKTALSLCDKLKNRESKDRDEKLRLTLMHVYHMYGMLYKRRIANAAKGLPMDVLDLCEKACELFTKCRDKTPDGYEKCHAYVGEISVRLDLCELIEKKGPGNIKKTIESTSTDPRLSTFLLDSISEIDTLIMSCFNAVPAEELDKSFYDLVVMYSTLFHKPAIGLDDLQVSDNSRSRRLKIALKKLKYRTDHETIPSLGNVSKDDLLEIINLYEANFQEVLETSCVGNRSALEMDHKEWIFAIRHADVNYQLEKVLTFVDNWNDNLQSPLSLFYLFVTTSLMGFGLNENGKSAATKKFFLQESKILKQRVQEIGKKLPQPRYPREWLGKGSGICQLISYRRFAQTNIDNQWRKIFDPIESLLVRCKGTICPLSKRLSGYIDLDLHDNSVSVKVFFVPKTCKLDGKRFEGTRVEFRLAFTLDHGYEAFNVVPLQTQSCSSCKTAVEMTSDETIVSCRCGSQVTKNDLDLFDL